MITKGKRKVGNLLLIVVIGSICDSCISSIFKRLARVCDGLLPIMEITQPPPPPPPITTERSVKRVRI